MTANPSQPDLRGLIETGRDLLLRENDGPIRDFMVSALEALSAPSQDATSRADKERIAELEEQLSSQIKVTSNAVLLLNKKKAALAAKEAEIVRKDAALIKCRSQFGFYAESHAAKRTSDGDAKAKTNADFVDLCSAALLPGEGQ